MAFARGVISGLERKRTSLVEIAMNGPVHGKFSAYLPNAEDISLKPHSATRNGSLAGVAWWHTEHLTLGGMEVLCFLPSTQNPLCGVDLRATHNTSARSIGFCVIWACISSSSSSEH